MLIWALLFIHTTKQQFYYYLANQKKSYYCLSYFLIQKLPLITSCLPDNSNSGSMFYKKNL